MRKKVLWIIMVSALVFTLCACGKDKPQESADAGLKIVGTVFPYCDFAENIAPHAAVSQLLPAGADSHSYEPTAADIAMVQSCDLFLRTGGEGEEWVDTILDAIDGEVKVLSLSECVSLYQHEDGDWDEHIWTSPENAKLICAEIAAAAEEIDTENASEYAANAEKYIAELDEISSEIKTAVDASAKRPLLFGDRFPFVYLARDYGIEYLAAFPGCGEETEPDAKTLASIAEKAKELEDPVILHIELSSEKVAKTLADETGAEILQLHSCHNLTKEERDGGATYLSLMKDNIEVLKVALG